MITTYSYDRCNRLQTANAGGSVTTYTYDSAGNRTAQITSSESTEYTWDAVGRMVSADVSAGMVSFTYDSDGRRVAKQSTDGSTMGYLYDFKKLLAETEDVGGEISNVYATTSDQEYGDLISEDGEGYAHQYDAQANTNALLDTSGAVQAKFKYDAWGNANAYSIEDDAWSTLSVDQWANMSVDQWANLPLDILSAMTFGGKKQYYRDAETELYLLGMGTNGRYYQDGRFLSEDPIRQAGGDPNLYPYVQSNPINHLDPSGHDAAAEERKREEEALKRSEEAAKKRQLAQQQHRKSETEGYILGDPISAAADSNATHREKSSSSSPVPPLWSDAVLDGDAPRKPNRTPPSQGAGPGNKPSPKPRDGSYVIGDPISAAADPRSLQKRPHHKKQPSSPTMPPLWSDAVLDGDAPRRPPTPVPMGNGQPSAAPPLGSDAAVGGAPAGGSAASPAAATPRRVPTTQPSSDPDSTPSPPTSQPADSAAPPPSSSPSTRPSGPTTSPSVPAPTTKPTLHASSQTVQHLDPNDPLGALNAIHRSELTEVEKRVLQKLVVAAQSEQQDVSRLNSPLLAAINQQMQQSGALGGAAQQLKLLGNSPWLIDSAVPTGSVGAFLNGERPSPLATMSDLHHEERRQWDHYDVGEIADPKLAVRAGGVGQAALSVAGAIVTAPTVLTGPGAIAFLSNVDNAVAGARTAWSGEYTSTATSAVVSGGLQKAGVGPGTSQFIGEATNILLSAKSNAVVESNSEQLTALSRQRFDNIGETLSRVSITVDPATVGTFGGNIRVSLKGTTAANEVAGGAPAAERAIPGKPDVVTGGSSTALGRNMMEDMGLPRSTNAPGHQFQHIIPKEMADHPVIQKIGMDLDHASNGIPLRVTDEGTSAMSRHMGYHSPYSEIVRGELDKMNINKPVNELVNDVAKLQNNLKTLQQQGTPLYATRGKFASTTREEAKANLKALWGRLLDAL